jgi:peptide/nickel transport system substrate-binding protein
LIVVIATHSACHPRASGGPVNAAAALDIVLRDLPQIEILEELHVVTFNDTGWPTAADPYVAPYTPWETFNLVIHH